MISEQELAAWKQQVRERLAQARIEALELLGQFGALSTRACKECGISVDRATPGCKSCRRRHAYRKSVGQPHIELALPEGHCKGCGEVFSGRTPRCAHCIARHAYYKRLGKPYLAAGCKACGCPKDEFTPGCKTCYNRATKRRSLGRGRIQSNTRGRQGSSAQQEEAVPNGRR